MVSNSISRGLIKATLPLFLATSVQAADHAVTVVAKSPAAISSLTASVPPQAKRIVLSAIAQFGGPLLSNIATDAPVGFWLDWNGELPSPVIFFQPKKRAAFLDSIKQTGQETRRLGNGITEIVSESPTYIRESQKWLFVSTSASQLQRVEDPSRMLAADDPAVVTLRINNNKIPQDTRSELINIVTQRLLPPMIHEPGEISLDSLVNQYTQRVLKDLTNQAQSITIHINGNPSTINLSVHADGWKLASLVQKHTRAALPGPALFGNGFRAHVSLRDEDVAALNQWSQALPKQIASAFEDASIDDRSGQEGMLEGVRILSTLLSNTAYTSELEACGSLVGPEEDTPIVGVRIRSGDGFAKELRRWVNEGYAAEFGVGGVELDLETVNQVTLHRLTFVDDIDAPLSIVVGIGEDRIFATAGNEGLLALRRLLNQSGQVQPPTPLQLQLKDVNVASILGWERDESQSGNLHISSEYTDRGIRYDIEFKQRKN